MVGSAIQALALLSLPLRRHLLALASRPTGWTKRAKDNQSGGEPDKKSAEETRRLSTLHRDDDERVETVLGSMTGATPSLLSNKSAFLGICKRRSGPGKA